MIPVPGTVYIVAAAFVAGAFVTYKVMDWKHDAELLREVKVAQQLERGLVKIVTKIEKKYIDRVVEIETKGITITNEVPVYVTKNDDSACVLNRGYVRVHDAAATNTHPGPATESDRAPAGVDLSRAANVQTRNYQAYHVVAAQLAGCIEAYNEVKEKINAGSGQ